MRPDPRVPLIMVAPYRRRMRRGRVGRALANHRRKCAACAPSRGGAVRISCWSDSRTLEGLVAEGSAGRYSARPEITHNFGTAWLRDVENVRTVDRSGLQAKRGVVPMAGQPLVAAPRRLGTRKNVSSSPPSTMENVDRFLHAWFRTFSHLEGGEG